MYSRSVLLLWSSVSEAARCIYVACRRIRVFFLRTTNSKVPQGMEASERRGDLEGSHMITTVSEDMAKSELVPTNGIMVTPSETSLETKSRQ